MGRGWRWEEMGKRIGKGLEETGNGEVEVKKGHGRKKTGMGLRQGHEGKGNEEVEVKEGNVRDPGHRGHSTCFMQTSPVTLLAIKQVIAVVEETTTATRPTKTPTGVAAAGAAAAVMVTAEQQIMI